MPGTVAGICVAPSDPYVSAAKILEISSAGRDCQPGAWLDRMRTIRDTILSFGILQLIVVGGMNLYGYTTTKNKTSLVAGLLMFLSGMGLLFLTVF